MKLNTRRTFMLQVVAGTTGLVAQSASNAQSASSDPVKETDAYPKSMGFRLNTANVDQAKFPRHEVSQKCSGCQLYSGKPDDALGTCSFFKRQVPPGGWCRNFKPKKVAA